MEISNGGQPQAAETQTAVTAVDPLEGITQESTSHPTEPEPQATEEPKVKPEESEEPRSEEKRPGKRERENAKIYEALNQTQAELAKMKADYEALKNPNQPKPKDPNAPPNETDYENYGEFLIAQAEHRLEQKLTAKQQEQQEKQNQEKEAHEFQSSLQSFETKEAQFKEIAPDYGEKIDEAVNSGLVTQELLQNVVKSQNPALAYHLATNADDLAIVSQLTGTNQLLALAKLDGILSARAPQAAVRTTKAAAPISPVKGQASTGQKNLGDMSQEEIEAWRYPNRR